MYAYTHLYVTYFMVRTWFCLHFVLFCTFFSTFPDTQVCTEAAACHCDISEVFYLKPYNYI